MIELRPWEAGDGPAFARYACDPAVARFMNPGFPRTPEACTQVVTELAAADPKVQDCRAIVVDGEVAGSVGLFLQGDGTAAVAYWLGVPFQGKGRMAKLLPEFCRAAFQRYPITALTARPHRDNAASRRTLERAGFQLSGDGETYILCLENRYDRFI